MSLDLIFYHYLYTRILGFTSLYTDSSIWNWKPLVRNIFAFFVPNWKTFYTYMSFGSTNVLYRNEDVLGALGFFVEWTKVLSFSYFSTFSHGFHAVKSAVYIPSYITSYRDHICECHLPKLPYYMLPSTLSDEKNVIISKNAIHFVDKWQPLFLVKVFLFLEYSLYL